MSLVGMTSSRKKKFHGAWKSKTKDLKKKKKKKKLFLEFCLDKKKNINNIGNNFIIYIFII